jgi:exopolysaccharide biosynthesis protein
MGNDVCILRNDGTMQVYQKGSFSSIDTIDETVWQAWAFGPALVENGVVSDTSGSKIRVKNPRCAIGYYEPGHYCLVVVDGRQKGYSDGMTLDELAQTFATLGCETAYNLDGCATAMMVFQGAVVNQPTNGGRTSSDIICF